jgi:hypothetical protein
MHFFRVTAVAAVLLVSATTLAAQADTTAPDMAAEDQVYIDVEGAAVQVDAALAAEACGLDEAAVIELAAMKMAESGLDLATMGDTGSGEDGADGEAAILDESNETVTTAQGTADPSTSAPGDEMLALAVCEIDVTAAVDLGIPQANEIVTD